MGGVFEIAESEFHSPRSLEKIKIAQNEVVGPRAEGGFQRFHIDSY